MFSILSKYSDIIKRTDIVTYEFEENQVRIKIERKPRLTLFLHLFRLPEESFSFLQPAGQMEGIGKGGAINHFPKRIPAAVGSRGHRKNETAQKGPHQRRRACSSISGTPMGKWRIPI